MVKKNKKTVLSKQEIIETRMRRFLAMIIDWYITNMLVVLPVTFYLRGDDYLKPYMFDLSHYDYQTAILLGILGLGIGLTYYLLIPTFVWKGQTLGKKICKIQIVTETNQDVTIKTMLVREVLGATVLEGGIVLTAAYIRKMLPLFGLASIVQPLQYIAYGITLLSIIYAYLQTNSQSFHDKLAKTIVIKK